MRLFIMDIVKLCGFLFLASLLSVTGLDAQQHKKSVRDIGVELPSAKGSVLLKLKDTDVDFGGVQFQLVFDPSVHNLSSGSCLDGVPDSHKGQFTTCNVIPEKGIVQLLISDIGENRLLPPGLLGVMEFNSKGNSKTGFEVKDFQALDTEGNSIMEMNASKFIDIEVIQAQLK